MKKIRLFDYIKNIACFHHFSCKCVLNFQVPTDVRCLDWDFLGCDSMRSCKRIPVSWSNLLPPSLYFKDHYGPENEGSLFHQNLVFTYKTAWCHTSTSENHNLTFIKSNIRL
jgi:hypothetical protein